MNNISHLCQAVLISSILTCVLSNCGVYGQNVQDDRVPALEEIDQLANKNSIPKRLGLRRLQIPVEYDWNEYDRVFALLESMPLSKLGLVKRQCGCFQWQLALELASTS